MNTTIKIEQTENGTFKATFSDENPEIISKHLGYGGSLKDAVEDLLFRYDNSQIKDEKEAYVHFIKEKQPSAFKLFVGLFDAMGEGWFTLKDVINKMNEPKELIELKMNFLGTFGYLQQDRKSGAGMRFRLTASEEERKSIFQGRINDLTSQIDKLQSVIEVIDEFEKPIEEPVTESVDEQADGVN